jgi:hypothetical protein
MKEVWEYPYGIPTSLKNISQRLIILPHLMIVLTGSGRNSMDGINRHLNVLGFEIEEQEIPPNFLPSVISAGIDGSSLSGFRSYPSFAANDPMRVKGLSSHFNLWNS